MAQVIHSHLHFESVLGHRVLGEHQAGVVDKQIDLVVVRLQLLDKLRDGVEAGEIKRNEIQFCI